jgi:hypothetical protein
VASHVSVATYANPNLQAQQQGQQADVMFLHPDALAPIGLQVRVVAVLIRQDRCM